MSQALDVIRVFYDVGCRHKSLPIWMSRMRAAISCAISGGLQFDRDDFKTIMSWRNRAWVGENTFEHFYTLATGMRHRDDVCNQGALEALELYMGRPVYNFDGGRLYAGRQLFLTNDIPSTHKKGWGNTWWSVSSFRDGTEPYVNLMCTSGHKELAGRRCKVTPADVLAMEKARKVAAKAAKEAAEMAREERYQLQLEESRKRMEEYYARST